MGFGQTQNGAELTIRGRKKIQVAATGVAINRGTNVHTVLVSSGTGAISLFDNTDGSGEPLWTVASTTVGSIYQVELPDFAQVYVTLGASTKVTLTYD